MYSFNFDRIIYLFSNFTAPKPRSLARGVLILPLFAYGSLSQAACNCGSQDAGAPCTGKTISVNVNNGSRNLQFNWSFNSDTSSPPARCGQFANGDYWLAPAAGQNSVTVDSITGVGGDIFVDENPQPEKMGFLNTSYFKRVSHLLSVTNKDENENILSRLPITYNTNTSLVAAIERNQSANGKCGTKAILSGCVDAYNVVTVLDRVPENAGATVLRPNIIRAQKDLISISAFNLARLPRKPYFNQPSASTLEGIRRRWAHHTEILSMRDKKNYGYSEGGRAFRASMLVDDYAAGVAAQWHTNLASLMSSSLTDSQRLPALASMLTYGKDIYYHVYNFAGQRERWFGVGAGQSLGRFPAAVFFAAMANDNKYGDVLKLASSTQVNIGGGSVHELDQVNLGPNGPVWGDGDDTVPFNKFLRGRYWGEMLVGQQFNGARHRDVGKKTGQRTLRDPYGYIDGPGQFPGISYASVSAGPTRSLAAEMLLMPRMCDIVNYDALVEYSLRITRVGRLLDNDPCAPPDPRELNGEIINKMIAAGVPGANQLEPCDTFRENNCRYYGANWDPAFTDKPTWGPDPDDPRRCITNGNDPISGEPQIGRFAGADQESRKFSISYHSLAIEDNWDVITQGKNSCREGQGSRPKQPIDFRAVPQ